MGVNVIEYLKREYAAIEMTKEECVCWLDDDETLIAGVRLPNKSKNYFLLSESDFCAFSDEECMRIQETKCSPFENMLVIFFSDAEGEFVRIVNGMASKLFDLMDTNKE